MARAAKQVKSKNLADVIEKYESRTFGFASKNFFVSFVAAVEVEKNWKAYFPEVVKDRPVTFDEIRLDKSISYQKVLKSLAISNKELEDLNLGLKRSVLLGRANVPAGYVVRVPQGMGGKLKQSLKQGSELQLADVNVLKNRPKPAYRYHRIRKGETLSKIARSFGTTVRDLAAANNIRNASRIRVGQKLRVPGAGSITRNTKRRVRAKPVSIVRHRIRPGETLGGIARKYGTSTSAIKRLNGFGKSTKIFAGRRLKIPSTKKTTSKARSVTYVVQKGDTLSAVASKHKTSLSQLKTVNPGLKDTIYPGQKNSNW